MLNQTIIGGRIALDIVMDEQARVDKPINFICGTTDPQFTVTGRWRRAGNEWDNESDGYPEKSSDTEWLESITYPIPVRLVTTSSREFQIESAMLSIEVPDRALRYNTPRDPAVYCDPETVCITVRGTGRFERM